MKKLSDLIIYCGSVIGLFCSLLLVGFGIASFPFPLSGIADSLSKITLLLLVPIMILFIFRYKNLTYDQTQREIDLFGYKGCPSWMRHTVNIISAVSIVLFFLPMLLALLGYVPKNDGTSFPSTLPGAFGLLIYSTLPAQLYSAKAMTSLSLHRSASGAR